MIFVSLNNGTNSSGKFTCALHHFKFWVELFLKAETVIPGWERINSWYDTDSYKEWKKCILKNA